MYGSVEAANLLEMPLALNNIPSLALQCSIDRVVPCGGTWDDNCLKFFTKLLLGNIVTVTIKVISDVM